MPPLPARVVLIRRLHLVAAGSAAVAALGACGHASYPPSPTPVRLEITGPVNHMVPGAAGQVLALVTLSDQSKSDVTDATAWSSSDPTVLTVSSTGLVHALTVGIVQIRASYAGLTVSANVEVASGP
jgi:hypothetical protein